MRSGEPLKEARTTARMTQAKASPMAPAEIATRPMGESARPFERTIQTSMGKAVIDKAAPKNNTCCHREAPAANQSDTP